MGIHRVATLNAACGTRNMGVTSRGQRRSNGGDAVLDQILIYA
eukprot:SAG25_NODE_107_length_15283_cov_3.516728_3_plen_43_part_00